MSLGKLVTEGVISPVDADTLWNALKENSSVVITGKTAVGKTTLAKALLEESSVGTVGLYGDNKYEEYVQDDTLRETTSFVFLPKIKRTPNESPATVPQGIDAILIDELPSDHLRHLHLLPQGNVPLIATVHGTKEGIQPLLSEEETNTFLVERQLGSQRPTTRIKTLLVEILREDKTAPSTVTITDVSW